MRRWISGLITVGVIAGAGVVGLSTIADAVPGGETGVDCSDPRHATNRQCTESFDDTGGSSDSKGCEKSKEAKNPHCAKGGTTGDTTVTTGGGGTGGGGTSGGGTSGGGTTASTAATAGAGGGQSTQVAGVVVTPGAAPTPGAPAPAQAAQPRFTG